MSDTALWWFMLIFGVIAVVFMVWERVRHRLNTMGTAVNHLESSLENNKPDSSGCVLVRWRRLFPMSYEMAGEYARMRGFEYQDATVPAGAMSKHLRFRRVD